jgi:hypothetical protein
MDQSEWDDKRAPVSTDALKELIATMRVAHLEYEAAKDVSNKLKEKYDELEAKVTSTLQGAGLKRFDVPGVGSCVIASKFSVRVPKDVESKRALFQYIREHYGANVLDEFRTINYQTLNAWFNKEAEAHGQDKKAFSVPGIEAPTEESYIQFRRDKTGGGDSP